MRIYKFQRYCLGLATVIAAAVMAAPASAAVTLPVNPNLPIPGVSCPAGTTQLTDTVARIDALCTVTWDLWKEVGGSVPKPPEITNVDTGPLIIPVDPTDPTKINDILDQFDASDEDNPPSDWGEKFQNCQTDPALSYCQTDVLIPPTIPDPNGPDITTEDPTGEGPSPSSGYHCDPRTWTSGDLVIQQTATPLDANGDPLDPIEIYVLNPDFPAELIPTGDSSQDPPLPSFLATRSGMAQVGTARLPYWLDDPRADNSAYIDPAKQGCVSIPNTAPTQAAADALTPSSALPDPGVDGGINVSWTAPEQTIATNGGDSITGYEVQTLKAGIVVPGKTCTKDFGAGDNCTVTGLTNATLYTFQVRAVNTVGAGPWSALTDPPLAPVKPARKKTKLTKASAIRGVSRSVAGLARAAGSLPPAQGPTAHASVRAHQAKPKKPAPPAAPTAVTVSQTVSAGTFPNNGAIKVSWVAPKVAGTTPITSYLVTATQVGETGVKTCTSAATVFNCVVDGLKKLPNESVDVTVQAINSVGKGAAGKAPSKFNFNVSCVEYSSQPKCIFTIRVKSILRMTGRKTEPADQAGQKWRVVCGYTPTVAYTTIKIKNPRFPADPTASPTLTLGEALNGICRIALIQVTPNLTVAQKALVKKGYVALGFKVVALPAKGSRERPIGLPYAIARVESPNANPVNGGLGPDGRAFTLTNGKKLDGRKLMADANGVITWIGVVSKAGYYPVSSSWPFYKPGKTFFTFPKSKAKK